jgi:hypothetical protein
VGSNPTAACHILLETPGSLVTRTLVLCRVDAIVRWVPFQGGCKPDRHCLLAFNGLLSQGVRRENVEKDWKKYWKLQDL